jgi:type II secretory pathway predicted ATPase ExeA
MYETAFGFHLRPFAAPPTVALYFPAANIEKSRTALARCVEHDSGPGLVVGPAGVGKSLLCQMLAEQFKNRFRVVVLASARLCTRRALLQNILFELGLPYRDMEEGELRLSLIDYLANDERASQGMLLIVDEAHCLPTRLLEEIRMITNLVRDGRPRVRLILAGSARLEERFASPKLESFNQRVSMRCYLEALSREESKAFVVSQLAAAGRGASEVFSREALDAVYDATGGVPRMINQLCDHALVLSAVDGRPVIDAAAIQEAWSDLQQLPAPWHMENKPAESVVEFGRLDPPQTGPPAALAAPRGELETPDPLRRLSEIEQSVAAAGDGLEDWSATYSAAAGAEDDDQFQPAGVIGPEVELVFHGPHAPFEEAFLEEEIVIDRYAALESARLAKLRQTPWSRDRAIPERLAEAQSRHDAARHEMAALSPLAEDDSAAIDPASDPVLPEYSVSENAGLDFEPERTVPLAVHPSHDSDAAHHTDDAETADDRDLIVVEDDAPNAPAGPNRPTGRVRRQEYRQLFARMRRG